MRELHSRPREGGREVGCEFTIAQWLQARQGLFARLRRARVETLHLSPRPASKLWRGAR